MKTGQRSDNRGFSLVELIVVMAILALMTGMFLLSSGILATRAGKQCAKQIRHELDQVRIATMGKNKVTMSLSVDSVGRVWVTEVTTSPKVGASGTLTNTETKQIGSARARVEVSPGGGAFVPLNTSGVNFEFNRSTGAFIDVTGGQIGGTYCIDEIRVSGGSQSHTLKLKKVTGKVEEID